jgi:hypothetical protein
MSEQKKKNLSHDRILVLAYSFDIMQNYIIYEMDERRKRDRIKMVWPMTYINISKPFLDYIFH